jgi:hypothetical protein
MGQRSRDNAEKRLRDFLAARTPAKRIAVLVRGLPRRKTVCEDTVPCGRCDACRKARTSLA